MADTISIGIERATQAIRFGWYLALNRVVGWQSDRLGMRPKYKPSLPAPSEREILADLDRLFRRDAQAVRSGLFPRLVDGLTPVEAIRRAQAMLTDVPTALKRRLEEDAATVRRAAPVDGLPDYYVQDFHYQTGGYLSDESARLYDIQVETLFLGGGAPMRREALRPIADFLSGKDQRRLALTDIACGTGRFLRDVRRNWPALGLTGVDLSRSYLAEAKRHLAGLRPASLIEANAEALPLPDASQDVVTSIFLFHELPAEARNQVSREMARILKPGGLAVLLDSLQLGDRPDWDGVLEAFPVRFHEPFFQSYVNNDVGRLLADAGLKPHTTWTSFLAKIVVMQKPAA